MNNEEVIGRIPASVQYLNNPFFIGAEGHGSYPNIDLLLPNPFNNLVNITQGLQPVAFFNDHNSEVIYDFVCRPVGTGPFDPTQEQFDEYSERHVYCRYVPTYGSRSRTRDQM